MKIIGWILLAVVATWWLLSARVGTAQDGSRINGEEARALVEDGAVLLDVRTPGEFASGHIEGAVLVPVQDLASRPEALPSTDTPVVVYCRSGRRSASAAAWLRDAGYEAVYDLGPMSAW